MRRSQLQNRANKLNITFIDEGDKIALQCPEGYCLAGTKLHYIDLYLRGWAKPDAYAALHSEMDMGMELCDGCPECDEN